MAVKRMKAGPSAVAEAVRTIRTGGVVAIPTDTVYGLACDPTNDEAVERVFEAKERQKKPVPILCSSLEIAESIVRLNRLARRLASEHWPGALTIVAPIGEGARLSRLLDQGSGNLGVRVPDSETCIEIASKVGGAITGTSANLSGQPSCRTADQVLASFEGRIPLVVDGGRLRGKESTVVRLAGNGIEVLREGSVRIQEGESKR